MDHIDEKTLELYVLGYGDAEISREEIEKHVGECPGCSALLRDISEYYDEVSEVRKQRATVPTEALTVRRMIARAPSYEDRPPAPPMRPTVPARIILFAIRHYAVSSIGIAAAFVAALLLLSPSSTPKDPRPEYARAKDEFLVAYNKRGEELWRKHVATGFDVYVAKWPLNRRAIFTADADRDGRNEVYCIYGDIPDLPFHSAIVAYDWDGTERWRYWYHGNVHRTGETFADDYECNSMIVADFTRSGAVEIIAEFGHHERYPNVVVKLDALTGALQGEYWHAGNIENMAVRDFDHDGIDDIFLTNTSMFDGSVPLVVVDPRAVGGSAPMPPGLKLDAIPPGTEKYYLLLPRSGLEKSPGFLSTAGEALYFKSDSLLEVIVYDRFKDGTAFALKYYFDPSMRCVDVYASEPNLAYYRKLQQEELTKRPIDRRFLDEMRAGIRYWDGDRFVSEPVPNSRYHDAVRPPS